MRVIDRFNGEYSFLSNFHPSEVEYDGEIYPTVEHAYQAAKTDNPEEREIIRAASTPGKAKRLGRRVNLRSDWEKAKIPIMTRLVWQKFANHSDLKNELLRTGDAELIEGNTWGDRFWGVSRGSGQNFLGRILMKVRESFRGTTQE